MALKVVTAKPYSGTLKVVTNTGMQGSTYNPQQTAPISYVQNAAPVYYYQPAAPARVVQGSSYNPQPTYSVSAAVRAQQAISIQRAAEAERVRQEAIRREQERLRIIKVKTDEHNKRLNTFRGKLNVTTAAARTRQQYITLANRKGHWSEYFTADGKLHGNQKYDEKSAPIRVREAYGKLQKALAGNGDIDDQSLKDLEEATRSKFRKTAQDIIKQRKKGNLFDHIFGRSDAQSNQAQLQNNWNAYEKQLKKLKADQAKKLQAIASAKAAGDWGTHNKLVDEYNPWLSTNVRGLVRHGAGLEGLSGGYEKEMNEGYTSRYGNVLSTVNGIAKKFGDAAAFNFRYTLGQGSKNVPSLTTAPTRALNFVKNLASPGDIVNKHGGSQEKQAPTLLGKWQQTMNQRALNLADAKNQAPVKGTNIKPLIGKNQIANNIAEFAIDVIPSFGTRGIGRGIGALASKFGKAVSKTNVWNRAAESPAGTVVKWLGQEHKTPGVQVAEARAAYDKARQETTAKYWPTYQKLLSQIKGGSVDFKVADDLAKLTDKEAAVLQRMRGLDKFAARDTLWLRRSPNTRAKLLDIHQRWQGIAENMRLSDAVKSERFKGNYYSHGWQPSGQKDVYNFRKFRKNSHTLKAKDLHAAQIERLFMSSLEETGQQVKGIPRLKKKAQTLFDEYNTELDSARTDLEKAISKKKFRREAPRFAAGLPMRAWRAATLPLRPAWYVNNSAYNEIAGALSAGPRFFAEQAKLLKPGALKAARSANPDVVSRIGDYNRGDWLYKAASAIEDNARLAAFKANKAKGKSDAESLSRTNKYLIDYTTKNWERPIKGLLPFWSWTKGIGRASIEMPFDRPLAAKSFQNFDENNNRKIEELPEDQRQYYENGIYTGKDKNGNPRFTNMPWLPFTTKNSSNVGVNPFIAAGDELYKNKDYYGNPLEDKGLFATLKSKFPQAKLLDEYRRTGKFTSKYLSERGSEGFALTKQQIKDDSGRGKKALDSFLGVPTSRSFDRKKYEDKKNSKAFYKEWFSHDWNKEYDEKGYDVVTEEQKKLSAKYGYDLEKDVYNGLFRKNDTPTTKEIKDLKDEARKWADEFYKQYENQAYGTKSRWAAGKIKEMIESGQIAKNAYYFDKIPKWYTPDTANKYAGASSAIQYKGKWFKSADSLARYKRYEQYVSGGYWRNGKRFSSSAKADAYDRYLSYKRGDYKGTFASKSSPYQFDGKFFKSADSMQKYKEGKFWKDYYATTDFTERRKMLDANPQYKSHDFKLPTTDEEWDLYKANRKAKQKAKLSAIPSWMRAFESYKASTPNRVKFKSSKKIVWKS